ncbi:unnamed protein product [Phytophthora fragariaefolia]|uniref:Unnamed protein product n=1 Tax=Phytophthora fragariaefolia TaxID=1490495 RepID=A0A9W6TS54_9STRA|nr:unnamed protein product [Phytophthora fragariaefolia]
MDNQALPRTSELEQPILAGRAQVGETLLSGIIKSGDDRTVVPQRAVSPRSSEIASTRPDHPSTWSVEVHTHRPTIRNRSEIQSHDDGHPTSVGASRSEADVHRQPTQSEHVRLQSNRIASTHSLELPVLDERAAEWFQQFIADEVKKRLQHDKGRGVNALKVRSTCSLPSQEDAVLDYLRTSGIESGQDHVKCDTDLPSYEQFMCALLALMYVTEPQTYKQAIASGEAAQWGKAMDSEIQSHEDNETWVLVPRPKGRNVLKNRWVYVIKYKSDGSVDRFKTSLVIKGFLEKYGIDYTEIFAPRASCR